MAKEKKTSLTPDEEVMLQQHFEMCMEIGTSTEPCKKAEAEPALVEMYKIAGKPRPTFWWFSSPASARLGHCLLAGEAGGTLLQGMIHTFAAHLKSGEPLPDMDLSLPGVCDQMREHLTTVVGDIWAEELIGGLGGRAGSFDEIPGNLRDMTPERLEGHRELYMGVAVRAIVTALRAGMESSGGIPSVPFLGFGQFDQYWVGYYEFMPRIGVEFKEADAHLLAQWSILSRSMGWWAPFEHVVLCCDRPSVCKINERRVLHAADGPAMAFRDGWEIHAINGVRVPKHVVETPQAITLEEVNGEENQEVRRIMIERKGWEWFLTEMKATVLDERVNPVDNVKESLLKTEQYCILLCACPSTARVYPNEVPLTTTTCAEAQGFLSCGLSERTTGAS